MHFFLNIH